jgi:hypothetical protein
MSPTAPDLSTADVQALSAELKQLRRLVRDVEASAAKAHGAAIVRLRVAEHLDAALGCALAGRGVRKGQRPTAGQLSDGVHQLIAQLAGIVSQLLQAMGQGGAAAPPAEQDEHGDFSPRAQATHPELSGKAQVAPWARW